MPDQPANIKLFRAKHRDKWHYLAETVAIRSNPVLIAPCGFESNGAPVFVETLDCPSDQLPSSTCQRCFTYLQGMGNVRQEPVKLRLRAIKGATESWRPEFMKKAD
jgi:hypothetical protein